MPNHPVTRQIIRLFNIMADLRSPGGCPWDASMTTRKLQPYLIEEACEVLDAIDSGVPGAICEELGDLLLQIVFHAQIHSEAGNFDLGDVARSISDKLIRRHPHVYAPSDETITADDLPMAWERIKRREKDERKGSRSGIPDIPSALPALLRTQKIWRKLSHNRRPQDRNEVSDALRRSLESLIALADEHAPDTDLVERTFTELLASVALFAQLLDVDCETALRRWNGPTSPPNPSD